MSEIFPEEQHHSHLRVTPIKYHYAPCRPESSKVKRVCHWSSLKLCRVPIPAAFFVQLNYVRAAALHQEVFTSTQKHSRANNPKTASVKCMVNKVMRNCARHLKYHLVSRTPECRTLSSSTAEKVFVQVWKPVSPKSHCQDEQKRLKSTNSKKPHFE